MNIPKNKKLLSNARRLRKEMAPQERKLWYEFLRDYPYKVYKQRIIGDYIADFYCHSAKLVIEIDGAQHFKQKDARRTAMLEENGLQVIRFGNREVDVEFMAVCELIDNAIKNRVNA